MSREMYRTRNVGKFPNRIKVNLEYDEVPNEPPRVEQIEYDKLIDLRYGTNPHQPAAYYGLHEQPTVLSTVMELKTGKGGLSQTNLEDIDRGMRIMRLLGDAQPACTFHKHINPSGVARGTTLTEAFERAYWGDARANFGGTMVFNGAVTPDLADKIMSTDFFEVILAPGIDPEALEILKSGAKYGRNKDIRALRYYPDLLAKVPAFSDEKEK